MNNFVLGQYVPGNSYLHKLDPRAKIISTIVLMVAIFFFKNVYAILVSLALIIILLLTARLSIIKAIKGLKPLLVLSLFVFIFQLLFNRQGDIIYNTKLYFSLTSISAILLITIIYFISLKYLKLKFLWLLIYLSLIFISLKYLSFVELFNPFDLNIYKEGLNTSLFVFFRLITIVFISTLLTLTTKPTDLTLAIEWLFRPLKIFKINPEEIALIITIALRYIPTILDEAYKIMDAQAARGADFKNGSLIKRIKQLVSLLVPMFVISFERSDELADAMLSRNFVPGKPKTRYHILKWNYKDTITLIIVTLFLGGAICLYILP